MPNKSEFSVQYVVAVPALDMRRHRAAVEPGVLTRAAGVDGRYAGAIRRFPGMRRLKQITFNAGEDAISNVQFFRYVSIQRGNSSDRLRGFVICAYDSGDSRYDVEFHYYDTSTSAWARYELDTNVGAAPEIDVAVSGKYLYYVQQGSEARVVYHTGSALTEKDMGPTATFVTPGAWTSAAGGTDGSGVLEANHEYGVAYRLWDQARNVYSGLSTPTFVTLGSAHDKIDLSLTTTAAMTAQFDKLQIFRTISAEAGGVYGGGVFYKVATATIAAAPGPNTYALGVTDGLNDREVAQQDYYDRILDGVAATPLAGRVATYQSTTFLAGVPGTGVEDLRAEVHWSPLHTFAPESFPYEGRYRLPSQDEEVVAFQEVGDYLFAVTPTVLYRFERIGNTLTIGRVHHGWGSAGRFAVGELDESLLLVGPGGVCMVKADSLSNVLVGALDRLVTDSSEWGGSLSAVSIASDSAMGCTFILNPDENEAAVIWRSTNTVTFLEDTNWALGTSGVIPTTAGNDVPRAFFINDNGLILYPDAYRSETKLTMTGVGGTVNGTTTSQDGTNPTTVLNDSGATFDTSSGLVGSYLHILSGDLAGESQVITANDGTSITVGSAFTDSIASGVRYSVAPIPFRLRYWPLTRRAGGGGRDLFHRWKVTSMGVSAAGLDLDDDSDNDYWTVGMYRQVGANLDSTKANVAIDANPADAYGYVQVDGLVLEPGLEQMASNVDFEVTALEVRGTLTESGEAT